PKSSSTRSANASSSECNRRSPIRNHQSAITNRLFHGSPVYPMVLRAAAWSTERAEEHMGAIDDAVVSVHSEWYGWKTAEVRIGDLETLHWRQPSGAPRLLLHGYVSCARIAGRLPHDCASATAPHKLLVCVLKKNTVPSVYAEIARRAGGPPAAFDV